MYLRLTQLHYAEQQKDVRRTQNLQRAVKEIILAYAYPRLDVEVSKKMNHLLKAPFCVHPKTGKVGPHCV